MRRFQSNSPAQTRGESARKGKLCLKESELMQQKERASNVPLYFDAMDAAGCK